MKRLISILFVLIIIFSLFSIPIYATEETEIFEYFYKNEKTYGILESTLLDYNAQFGFETEREIKMGNSEKEITAAIFDEEKIIIYCKDIKESNIKMSLQNKQLAFLFKPFREKKELTKDLENFVSLLSNTNSHLSSIILPLSVNIQRVDMADFTPASIRTLREVTNVISIILGYLSIAYLLYILIYVLYCVIKKKKIQRVKTKAILSAFSIFYLLIGGLSSIISFILSITIM
jgi:hypothetical protein